MPHSFEDDCDFLAKHTRTIVLGDRRKGAIVLAPEYQGRVMTSTAGGTAAASFGWINYELIQSGQRKSQINLYGGEERFWLAPEGGKYSIFFPPTAVDQPLDFCDWRVPECIDTDGFEVVGQSETEVHFTHTARLQNRFGFTFDLGFDRRVGLLSAEDASQTLGCPVEWIQSLDHVVHESQNTLQNCGDSAWRHETGLLCIWVLCMNSPSPGATLIVPYQSGSEEALGPIVNAEYFGKLGSDRLVVDPQKAQIYLLGDGQYRSKLGLRYPRAKSILGSWDRDKRVLTIVWFNLPEANASQGGDSVGICRRNGVVDYVNNVWQVQDDEFSGDVINGYNDGPNESGEKLGGFYELESLSPGLCLQPKQAYTHIHRTIHLQATTEKQLQQIDQIARHVFDVNLETIENVFQ